MLRGAPPVLVTPLALPEVLLVEPRVARDARGWFFESWNAARFEALGLGRGFVQDNVSRSSRGVVRGLHLQHPFDQAKLVSVLHGEVYDVAVDVRRGSPTFGRWCGARLRAEDGRQLYVPEGFAHGFVVLSDEAVVTYKVTDRYDPDAELTIAWDDHDIGVAWPLDVPPVLSARDARAPRLRDVPTGRLPVYVGDAAALVRAAGQHA